MVAGAKHPWRNSGEAWCCKRNWEKAAWLASGISTVEVYIIHYVKSDF